MFNAPREIIFQVEEEEEEEEEDRAQWGMIPSAIVLKRDVETNWHSSSKHTPHTCDRIQLSKSRAKTEHLQEVPAVAVLSGRSVCPINCCSRLRWIIVVICGENEIAIPQKRD